MLYKELTFCGACVITFKGGHGGVENFTFVLDIL